MKIHAHVCHCQTTPALECGKKHVKRIAKCHRRNSLKRLFKPSHKKHRRATHRVKVNLQQC